MKNQSPCPRIADDSPKKGAPRVAFQGPFVTMPFRPLQRGFVDHNLPPCPWPRARIEMNAHRCWLLVCGTLLVWCAPAIAAEEPQVLVLWPAGAPGALGNEAKDKPTLTVYLPEKEKGTGAAIVICPGGGYGHVAIDHEGHQIARWLNSVGVAGIILDYRHRSKGYGHPAPLQDAQRAVRTARAKAGLVL